jgi:hypothetical protein
MKRRKPIRPISKERAAMLRKYYRLRRRYLEDHPWCEVFPELRATEIHHVRGRAGEMLLDVRYWMPVSRAGHRWIHEHPEEARERGWLADKGRWLEPD